ncbi:unnamed protein product [Closterium sp. NIES-64]|nr:unnamed protein product [Closterium sp. NIES-64]
MPAILTTGALALATSIVLVVNDCAYRSLFTSRWVLFLDLDEYLYVSQPLGSSLITALTRYEVSQCASYQLARSLFTSRWVLFLALDEYLYVSQPLGSSLITALARYEVTPISSLRIFASCSRCALFLDFDEYLYASQPLGSSLITALNRYEVSLMCVHLAFAITSRRVLFLGFDEYLYVSQPFGSSLITALSRYDSSTSMVLLSSLHSLAVLPLTLTARSCWVLFPDFDEYLFVSQPLGSYLITALTLYESSLLRPFFSSLFSLAPSLPRAYVSFGRSSLRLLWQSLLLHRQVLALHERVCLIPTPLGGGEDDIPPGGLLLQGENLALSVRIVCCRCSIFVFCVLSYPPSLSMQQAAYVSFGSLYFYTDKCSHSMNVSASSPPRWEVERMIFRQADVHCVAPKRYESRDMCLGFDGHRKYIADPRKVKLFGVSETTGSCRGCLSGRRGVYLAEGVSIWQGGVGGVYLRGRQVGGGEDDIPPGRRALCGAQALRVEKPVPGLRWASEIHCGFKKGQAVWGESTGVALGLSGREAAEDR